MNTGSEDSNNVIKYQKFNLFTLSDIVNIYEDKNMMSRIIRNEKVLTWQGR